MIPDIEFNRGNPSSKRMLKKGFLYSSLRILSIKNLSDQYLLYPHDQYVVKTIWNFR